MPSNAKDSGVAVFISNWLLTNLVGVGVTVIVGVGDAVFISAVVGEAAGFVIGVKEAVLALVIETGKRVDNRSSVTVL